MYVIVAIDYYTKHEEVKPLAKISKLRCDEIYPMDLDFLPLAKVFAISELHPMSTDLSRQPPMQPSPGRRPRSVATDLVATPCLATTSYTNTNSTLLFH